MRKAFGDLIISTVYRTRAVGFEGDDFYNLVVGFETTCDPHLLSENLRHIELEHGRKGNLPRFSPRTLDLDLLTYGDRVIKDERLNIPRDDIEKYSFVLGPLAEVAPLGRHPVTGESYAEMWARFDQGATRLTPIHDLFSSEER